MINMVSFCFALVVLINLGVNGQNNNFNTPSSNTVDPASFFGRLHQLIDSQNQDQPAPVSCFRVRPNIKNAYPIDNTKYFICRDEQRYEIFTCPNGGIFDDRQKACIDLCEQRKPCLNQGQCIILSNLTLQCVCRRDWTGERCEIPLSTCANNPCGPNAECRMLVASDYPQDYVCICNNQQSYGRNCEQPVPNPCLANIQQFHPFAFSRHAYINCDDKLIFFQPCNSRLYWNQEEKRCDRSLPLLFRAPFLHIRNRQGLIQQNQANAVQLTQEQNLLTLSQGSNNQQGLNQVPNQLFTTQSQPSLGFQSIPNQPPLTNTLLETTTVPPRIFHLQGFLTPNLGQQNTQWQNNGNNQFQSSGNFQTQSIGQSQLLQDQNQQTNSQLPSPIQQNDQLGFIQQQQPQRNNQPFQNPNDQFLDLPTGSNDQNSPVPPQSGQWIPLSSETATTTINTDGQQGRFIQSLRGWKSNQRGASNQMDQPDTLNLF